MGSVVLVTVTLAALLWGVMAAAQLLGRVLFSENPRYTIQRLKLTSDGKVMTPALIKDAATSSGELDLDAGVNLFAVDLEKVRKSLESVSVIDRVEVSRELPDTLIIRVTERVAVARLGDDRGRTPPLAIDREGYVLGPRSYSRHLPMVTGIRQRGLRPGSKISGPQVEDALEVLDICDTTGIGDHVRIKRIDVREPDHLDLQLKDGVRVVLARDGLEWRLRKVAATLLGAEQDGTSYVSIDMMGEHPIGR